MNGRATLLNAVDVQQPAVMGPVNWQLPCRTPASSGTTDLSLSERVTLYDRVSAKEGDEIPIQTIIDGIRNGRWRLEIEDVRRTYEQRGKEAADELKVSTLPAFTASGVFAGPHQKEAIRCHNGMLQIDLDDLGDRLETVRAQVRADQHLVVMFRSPKNGLKALFRVPPDVAGHEPCFNAIRTYFKTKYDLEIDPSCRDISRLCFVSYDPEIYVNPSAVVFDETGSEVGPSGVDDRTKSAGDPVATFMSGVPAGQRNNAAFRCACVLRDRELPHDAVLASVLAGAAKCSPPMAPDEAESVVRSAFSKAPHGVGPGSEPWPTLVRFGEPTSLPEFPQDALPEPFRSFVADVARTVQVPVDLPGMLVLGVASVAAARRFVVHVAGTHVEPVNLYIMALMPPGERKSAVFDRALRPVIEYESEIRRQAGLRVEATKQECAVVEMRIARLRKRAASEDDPDKRDEFIAEIKELALGMEGASDIPTLLTGGDTTPEALPLICEKNGGRIAQVDAEGGALFRLFGAYQKPGASPAVEFHLKAHAGEFFTNTRVGRPQVRIERAALTIVVTGQPDILRRVPDKELLRARGLIARFLIIVPKSLVGLRTVEVRESDSSVVKAYHAAVLSMLKGVQPLPPPADVHELSLDADAFAVWQRFAQPVERDQAEAGPLADARDFSSKLAGAVARIGGLLKVMGGARSSCTIGADEMRSAVRLGEFLLKHWQAAIELGAVQGGDRAALRVVAWLRRIGAPIFSEADAWRDLRSGMGSQEELREALDALEGRGYIRGLPDAKIRGRGRPATRRYEVRPANEGGIKVD